jgi:hypothetical protein
VTGAARGARLGTWAPVAAAIAAAVAVAVVAGPGRQPGGAPLDPRATGPLGAKGLVEVLRGLGAHVRVTDRPPSGPGTALVLADGLSDPARDGLRAWVRAGGTLLVADPTSPLSPFRLRSATGTGARTLERRCGIAALAGVERVRVDPVRVLVAPRGAVGCFPARGGHWLVVGAEGAGVIVVVGGPGAFVNRALASEDNAALAAAILVPRPGTHVSVLVPPVGGVGDRGLWSLLAPSVKVGLAHLGAALVVAALWRGRRLGAPVAEAPAVAIDASELVAAAGRLMHRAGASEHAASVLRADLARELGERARTDPVLAGPPPTDEAALVALARELEHRRKEVRRG